MNLDSPNSPHCLRCGFSSPESFEICPGCGAKQSAGAITPHPTASEPAFGFVQKYFFTLKSVLTEPTLFFKNMPTTGGIGGPLAFALITHWVGSAIQYLWRGLFNGMIGNILDPILKMAGDLSDVDSPGRSAQLFDLQQKFVHWFWGVGSIIADPFLNLVGILVTAVFIFVGAKILVPQSSPREVNYETVVRILCFGMAPSILAGIPILGGLVSWTFVTVVTIIGAREVFRVTSGRATLIALFPQLLVLGAVLAGFSLMLIFFFKMFSSAFGF